MRGVRGSVCLFWAIRPHKVGGGEAAAGSLPPLPHSVGPRLSGSNRPVPLLTAPRPLRGWAGSASSMEQEWRKGLNKSRTSILCVFRAHNLDDLISIYTHERARDSQGAQSRWLDRAAFERIALDAEASDQA